MEFIRHTLWIRKSRCIKTLLSPLVVLPAHPVKNHAVYTYVSLSELPGCVQYIFLANVALFWLNISISPHRKHSCFTRKPSVVLHHVKKTLSKEDIVIQIKVCLRLNKCLSLIFGKHQKWTGAIEQPVISAWNHHGNGDFSIALMNIVGTFPEIPFALFALAKANKQFILGKIEICAGFVGRAVLFTFCRFNLFLHSIRSNYFLHQCFIRIDCSV